MSFTCAIASSSVGNTPCADPLAWNVAHPDAGCAGTTCGGLHTRTSLMSSVHPRYLMPQDRSITTIGTRSTFPTRLMSVDQQFPLPSDSATWPACPILVHHTNAPAGGGQDV